MEFDCNFTLKMKAADFSETLVIANMKILVSPTKVSNLM
jgi:hypothetical protein